MVKADENRQFTVIAQGEQAARSTDVDEGSNVVSVTRTTKHPQLGRVQHQWTLDFSQVSQADLLELASRTVVINFQRLFRDDGDPQVDRWDQVTIDVQRDMLDRERKPADPKNRIASDWAKLSEDERAQLMEQLKAQMGEG